MQITKGQSVNLEIQKLAYGGKGISALADGRKVFIDGVIPGDSVEAYIFKSKKKYAEAYAVKVLKPSPLRAKTKCKHFPMCGGCKWQMLPYDEQLKFKEEQVRECLAHIGGFKDSNELVKKIIGCKEPWFYRNKMEFSFGNMSKEDTELRLGLHCAGKKFDIFDLEECFLQSEKDVEILARVREFAKKYNLDFYHPFSGGDGKLSSIFIRDSKSTGEIMVNLHICESGFEHTKEFVEALKDFSEIVSIYLTVVKRKIGVPTRYEENLIYGKPCIKEELTLENGGKLQFKISPQSFFQPNTRQAEVLYGEVLKAAGLSGEEIVFDLYCGTGTIGLFCAHKAKHVYGLEISESAVHDAKQNAILNGIANASFAAGDVYKNIMELPATPDVVIVDPPRAGLGEKVIEKIDFFGPKKLIYVSCDPANLARDLKIFKGMGYKISSVQPVDMFPHTYHIENVAVVER